MLFLIFKEWLYAAGKEGNLTRAQDKSLADKESNSTSLNEKLSLQLQTPGASALSSLASTGGSNKSSLITVKSAPSGLDQIQPTEPTPQPPALLTRTVTQVQPTSVQAPSSSQNTPFSATSSGGPRLAPSWGTVSSGHLGNDKSSRSFTPKTTSAFSQHSLQREHGLQTGVQKVSTIRSATATPGRSFGASEVEAGFILELEEARYPDSSYYFSALVRYGGAIWFLALVSQGPVSGSGQITDYGVTSLQDLL